MDKMALGNELFVSLEKKLITFNQYSVITKKMRQTLATLKAEELENLLSERQQRITEIQHTDLTIGELITKMGGPHSIPNKIRDTIDRCLDKINAVARMIQPLDNELMILVKTESDGIKNELLKLRHSQNATMTYGRQTSRSPRFLDTRS